MVVLLILTGGFNVCAQPVPGDVFREYTWIRQSLDAGQALRVGGSVGTTENDPNWKTAIIDGYWVTESIVLNHTLDLEHAVKAEVNIEKILCHDGTVGLGIQINDQEWIDIPEAEGIPFPQSSYQHHIYPTVPVSSSSLHEGAGNRFRMRVSAAHPWNWPQNLINGVLVRIYYDASMKPHPSGVILAPRNGQAIGTSAVLQAEAESPNGSIKQVDYIGFYEDVNFEGDGNFRQWHGHFFHGRIMHHLGTSKAAPFDVIWSTEWVPDQAEPFRVAARITDESGIILFTEAVDSLTFERDDLSVELCKPYQIPKTWVTRNGEYTEKFDVKGDLTKALAYQLVWVSWSPGYMNGITINNTKVFDKEGPLYQYYAHRVTLHDPGSLKSGENRLKTGMTPLVNGSMVHGMEVEYPGIMVLIQYDLGGSGCRIEPPTTPSFVLRQNYPNPFNSSTVVRYALEKPSTVILRIHNCLGETVRTLFDGYREKGDWTVPWDGEDAAGLPVNSGLYFCQIELNGFTATKKMLLLR
jgi:hypothetical protein